MLWFGISLVVVGAVGLLAMAVVLWLSGVWTLSVVLGVFGLVALACVVCMVKIGLDE